MSPTKNKNIFHFKQFSVDQSDCAMKVNTDGVLLGALTFHENPQFILDIGTGTGVIAMMLAQRFSAAKIDAIEIDVEAANTAKQNFENSAFNERLELYCNSFQQQLHLENNQKYDLIVSNPPFFINSLPSSTAAKTVAKHADKQFFEELLHSTATHLHNEGVLELILPLDSAELVKVISKSQGLCLQKVISVHSFDYSIPHREILTFGFKCDKEASDIIVIYNQPKEYTTQYQDLLKDFLTLF